MNWVGGLLVAAAAALTLAGCGGGGTPDGPQQPTRTGPAAAAAAAECAKEDAILGEWKDAAIGSAGDVLAKAADLWDGVHDADAASAGRQLLTAIKDGTAQVDELGSMKPDQPQKIKDAMKGFHDECQRVGYDTKHTG